MTRKTTRDEINLDLDGSIDDAIAELQSLKKQHPNGRLHLTSDFEYGESYPRLKLEFTRPMKPVEIEFEKWRNKRDRLGQMQRSAAAFAAEGVDYPKAARMAKLKDELGCFADADAHLIVFEDQVLASNPMRGARTRDGVWVLRTFGADEFEKRASEMGLDLDQHSGLTL